MYVNSLLMWFVWIAFRQTLEQNVTSRQPEGSKENVQQDVEWQALDVLVSEASSRLGDETELGLDNAQSKDPPGSVFVLGDGQSFPVEEKLVSNVVVVTMSDNKQHPQQQPQPAPPQSQQQAAAVLDQSMQQVQVQVSVLCWTPARVPPGNSVLRSV